MEWLHVFIFNRRLKNILKHIWFFFDIEPPKTHNLENLLILLIPKDQNLNEFQNDITNLTPFAVDGRYPEFDEIATKDWVELSNLSKKIRMKIRPIIKKSIKG